MDVALLVTVLLSVVIFWIAWRRRITNHSGRCWSRFASSAQLRSTGVAPTRKTSCGSGGDLMKAREQGDFSSTGGGTR